MSDGDLGVESGVGSSGRLRMNHWISAKLATQKDSWDIELAGCSGLGLSWTE
jgi:hypothetical protein